MMLNRHLNPADHLIGKTRNKRSLRRRARQQSLYPRRNFLSRAIVPQLIRQHGNLLGIPSLDRTDHNISTL